MFTESTRDRLSFVTQNIDFRSYAIVGSLEITTKTLTSMQFRDVFDKKGVLIYTGHNSFDRYFIEAQITGEMKQLLKLYDERPQLYHSIVLSEPAYGDRDKFRKIHRATLQKRLNILIYTPSIQELKKVGYKIAEEQDTKTKLPFFNRHGHYSASMYRIKPLEQWDSHFHDDRWFENPDHHFRH